MNKRRKRFSMRLKMIRSPSNSFWLESCASSKAQVLIYKPLKMAGKMSNIEQGMPNSEGFFTSALRYSLFDIRNSPL